MYKNMIRTSIFNLTSMDIDILRQASEGYFERISWDSSRLALRELSSE